MQKLTLFLAAVLIASTSFAKVWRVNNNVGVVADFTQPQAAVSSASVVAGDTIHIEPSATNYSGISVTKRLVFIGVGYLLNPSDASLPGNSGLQFTTQPSTVGGSTIEAGGAGSKFLGLTFSSLVGIVPGAGAMNLVFEKVFFNSQVDFNSNGAFINSDGIAFRKCYFQNGVMRTSGTVPTVSNLTVENCIFYPNAYISLDKLTGTGNVIRNNSFYNSNQQNIISNAYVANNIFDAFTSVLTNCTIKNNLFRTAQPLPGTATGNQVSVVMTNVYVGGTTGSLDSRVALKTGSPAIGAGVTIAGYTPDAGAFGGPDPYKLSGIPPIPSIYSLTVPTSIPTGAATMNVTFSSRNNN